jgi:large subunit ribosomal protein L1
MAEAKKATKATTETKTKKETKEAELVVEAAPATEEAPQAEKATAKAGKRSAKAIAEVEEKQAKEERKASGQAEEPKPKSVVKSRSRLERRGKGFRKSAELIEKGKNYSLTEALELAKKTSHVKFDATVEMHLRLGVDPRHADQNIRDNLVLPAGTGKEVNVVVLSDELFADLEKGKIEFDVLIATPEQMPKLAKYARLLGPRGLMPNPKSGTVTTDTKKAVEEAKAGRVEYRVDSTGIVHLGIGKASFTPAQLQQNAEAVIASVKANKPQSVKGNYFKSVYLTTSMGPSVAVDLAAVN